MQAHYVLVAAAKVQEILARQAATFIPKAPEGDVSGSAAGGSGGGGRNPFSSGNPIVFMEIEAGGKKMGTARCFLP